MSHTNFDQLHRQVQRWVWQQDWKELRDIQKEAIEPILQANTDVIISAPTAMGKTEAAFLPACSRIMQTNPNGVGILYISPLKALINDQYRRLQSLTKMLDIFLTPWHGDASLSKKNQQRHNPGGIILITPESLEAQLMRHGSWCQEAFASLEYVIIDEFHAFLGRERGYQLQSLLHRLEHLNVDRRIIPRIALSATFSDMQQVKGFLRPPQQKYRCNIINSQTSDTTLKLQLRGYLHQRTQITNNSQAHTPNKNPTHKKEPQIPETITQDLYRMLRGTSNLIFANTRKLTEEISVTLTKYCKNNGIPNEFFPHHGNLSKETREILEKRLQKGKLPTSAVCTMTLELGIDIGSVDSVAQVTAPYSVSSLRQRLGRSGRRDGSAILRLFIPEKEREPTNALADTLRIQTTQSIAILNLLLRKWYEPPTELQFHLSTLIQQTLSVIAQYGGVRADQLWHLLCKTGPFSLTDQKMYMLLLRSLSHHHLITQLNNGQLVLGIEGEALVNHYHFYTAFKTPVEYRLRSENKQLGTISIEKPLCVGQLIIFAGVYWEVKDINLTKLVVTLKKTAAGTAPKFGGIKPPVHDTIRKEMRRVYVKRFQPTYLNQRAQQSLSEGIEAFHSFGLENRFFVQEGKDLYILPWRGDSISRTMAILLTAKGFHSNENDGIIRVANCTHQNFSQSMKSFLDNPPTLEDLGSLVPDTIEDKHDKFIPQKLREMAYAQKHFDIDGTLAWLKEHCK